MGIYDRDYMGADRDNAPRQTELGYTSYSWSPSYSGDPEWGRPVTVTTVCVLVSIVSGAWNLVAHHFYSRPDFIEYSLNQKCYQETWQEHEEYLQTMEANFTLSPSWSPKGRYHALLTYPLLIFRPVDFGFRIFGLIAFGVALERLWGSRKVALLVFGAALTGGLTYLFFQADWSGVAGDKIGPAVAELQTWFSSKDVCSGLASVVWALVVSAAIGLRRERFWGTPLPFWCAALVYAAVDLFGVLNFGGQNPPYALQLGGGVFGILFLIVGYAIRRERGAYVPVRRLRNDCCRSPLGWLLAVTLVLIGVYLLILMPDSPGRKIARAFTVESPRCLICNRHAVDCVDYYEQFDSGHSQHWFRPRHEPPERLTYQFWPEADKYLLIAACVVATVMGMGMSLTIPEQIGEGEYASFVVSLLFYGFAWVMNNLAVWVN